MDPLVTVKCEESKKNDAFVVENIGEAALPNMPQHDPDCEEPAASISGTASTACDVKATAAIQDNSGDLICKEEDQITPTSPVSQSSGLLQDLLSLSSLESNAEARQKSKFSSSISERSHTLLSLPIDSLHCIASFSTPSDWASVSLTGHVAHRVGRDIFRRVRLHGFRCATEVVTAWKLGQHSDAAELSALYIKGGVPIYPHSLGHSYHTLAWRMGVETKEMKDPSSESRDNSASEDEVIPEVDTSTSGEEAAVLDQFYSERFPVQRERFAELSTPSLTYLEEKCVFWHSRETGADDLNRSGDSQTHSFRPPKLIVKVHRHLADQHLLAQPKVDDAKGAMTTPPVSLSADFFHPHFESCSATAVAAVVPIDTHTQRTMPHIFDSQMELDDATQIFLPSYQSPVVGLRGPDDENQAELDATQRFSAPTALQSIPALRPTRDSLSDESVPSGMKRAEPASEKSILSNVQLETYSAPSSKHGEAEQKDAVKRQLQSRFKVYQKRMDALLSVQDNSGIDECLLDFWDEFLPTTQGIHFYDRHTAVPRKKGLEDFLSKPCPKAVGIIQCEIERIKVSSKKKGVSMKGRLFPTYEYRLFIRDRRSDSLDNSDDEPEPEHMRQDTVLLMAKNLGRNHPGGTSSLYSSKKGVNNYYLHKAQQSDVDSHFKAVNSVDPASEKSEPLSTNSGTDPPLLGRLQSNFTGTEFQIFTPTKVKKGSNIARSSSNVETLSDGDDLDYDSGVASDSTSPRRRVSLRHRLSNPKSRGRDEFNDELARPYEEKPTRDRRRSLRRSRSLPVIPYGGSRRAIAHSIDPPTVAEPQEVTTEEENGAITYTANLLGNRPRIMDVCIPKVTPDGCAGSAWKKYMESCSDESADAANGNRMLHHFKQLQQRQQATEGQNMDNPTDGSHDGSVNGDNDDYGLLPLQNRPPWWNVELGAFVLNFGGRVSVASVKNFQLCHRNDQDYIMLQFGRTEGRHSFTMDFQHPLTAVQAFAIAISSLQSKISFG